MAKLITIFIALPLLACSALCGESHAAARSANFIVRAAPEYEKTIATVAERFRKELAIEWLGHELPDWGQPCPISATIEPGQGNGGSTSFVFDRGQVFGFKMDIHGDPREILESTLKHEILHTVFATHFRQSLPRWADEGACSTVESASERIKHHRGLVQFLKTGRGIAFDRLFALQEYPPDILPLYAQGHSVATFLIEHGGKRHFVDFLAVGLRDQDWPGAVAEMYGYRDLGELQTCWLDWFRNGSRSAPKEVRVGYG